MIFTHYQSSRPCSSHPGLVPVIPASFQSSRTRSGIQLLSLGAKPWIPANKSAGMTVSKRTGKTLVKSRQNYLLRVASFVIPDSFRDPLLAFLRSSRACSFWSSRACSGIQLLSLSSQKWIPANRHAGKTISHWLYLFCNRMISSSTHLNNCLMAFDSIWFCRTI